MILRLSRQAERDLEAQIDWLADHSPKAARKALARILGVFDLLQDHPNLVIQTNQGWREKAVDFGRDGYVICYVVRATDILVVRFFHGRQDRSPTLR